jgi:ABC-type multidrug transport system fused ATPase/permease subunit
LWAAGESTFAESGTFDELLARKGFFSYLYNIQAWNREAAS